MNLIEKIKEFNHEIQIHSFRIIDNYIIKNSVNLKNNYIPDFLIEAFHELRNSPDEKKRLFAFELRKYIKDPVLLDQVDKYFEKILLQAPCNAAGSKDPVV